MNSAIVDVGQATLVGAQPASTKSSQPSSDFGDALSNALESVVADSAAVEDSAEEEGAETTQAQMLVAYLAPQNLVVVDNKPPPAPVADSQSIQQSAEVMRGLYNANTLLQALQPIDMDDEQVALMTESAKQLDTLVTEMTAQTQEAKEHGPVMTNEMPALPEEPNMQARMEAQTQPISAGDESPAELRLQEQERSSPIDYADAQQAAGKDDGPMSAANTLGNRQSEILPSNQSQGNQPPDNQLPDTPSVDPPNSHGDDSLKSAEQSPNNHRQQSAAQAGGPHAAGKNTPLEPSALAAQQAETAAQQSQLTISNVAQQQAVQQGGAGQETQATEQKATYSVAKQDANTVLNQNANTVLNRDANTTSSQGVTSAASIVADTHTKITNQTEAEPVVDAEQQQTVQSNANTSPSPTDQPVRSNAAHPMAGQVREAADKSPNQQALLHEVLSQEGQDIAAEQVADKTVKQQSIDNAKEAVQNALTFFKEYVGEMLMNNALEGGETLPADQLQQALIMVTNLDMLARKSAKLSDAATVPVENAAELPPLMGDEQGELPKAAEVASTTALTELTAPKEAAAPAESAVKDESPLETKHSTEEISLSENDSINNQPQTPAQERKVISSKGHEFRRIVVQEIFESAVSSKNNVNRQIEVELRPQHLGKIIVRITSDEEGLSAKVMATNGMVRSAIGEQIDQIRQNLQTMGVDLKNIDITSSDTGSFGQQLGGNRQGNQQRRSKTAEANARPFSSIESVVDAIAEANGFNRLA